MEKKRPILGISAGDPAGVGPEITAKALSLKEIYAVCKPLVVCDAKIIEQIIGICGLNLSVNAVTKPDEGKYEFGTVDVLDMHNIDEATFRFNEVSVMTGKASFEYVAKVIELAKSKMIDATITGPIHKEAIQKAGFHFAGHTEIYAALTNTKDYTMMLADGGFRVAHVSTHVSLLDAIKRVKKDRVLKVIQLANDALKKIDIKNPRIAVAGLNPHAGENGLFGKEEIDEILPAIEEAKKLNIHAEGPFPPDTIFPKMKGGQYDIVICMYHDQGHIPTKLLGFNYNHEKNTWEGLSGVNITLGLPIIRVSVDHGVAFDKGGKGEANPESMIQAIRYGARLAGSGDR
ncbi:4-hydroxythreonine-4-phosphate dehydrogenase PdxA [Chryseolinea sp. H1M3-3]|uniref:4-hydroxythreonine-4-phosphate dehydrogenase PdxA n=1 Tax=Chryseolinea sp. H1M3-3 TaxID=3034144 RepID=UPI0023EC06ED|nr:4-hydroxythreonine-4-phosphate dehydrogenase PdxA [Chryseolinea sp. H1M3-3]